MTLEVGQQAPEAVLVNGERKAVKVSELRGKTTVFAFFPAAFTGTCTKEMCRFRDDLSRFNSLNAQVYAVDLRVQRVEPAQVVAEPAHLLGARAGERRRKEREHRRLAAQFAHLDRLAFAVHENGFRRLLPDFECHAPPPVNKVFDFMIAGRLLLHHLADAVRDPREAAIVANGRGRRAIPARRLRGGQPCNYSVTRRPRTARAAAPSARSSPGSRSRARSRPARAPGCPSSRRPC